MLRPSPPWILKWGGLNYTPSFPNIAKLKGYCLKEEKIFCIIFGLRFFVFILLLFQFFTLGEIIFILIYFIVENFFLTFRFIMSFFFAYIFLFLTDPV